MQKMSSVQSISEVGDHLNDESIAEIMREGAQCLGPNIVQDLISGKDTDFLTCSGKKLLNFNFCSIEQQLLLYTLTCLLSFWYNYRPIIVTISVFAVLYRACKRSNDQCQRLNSCEYSDVQPSRRPDKRERRE